MYLSRTTLEEDLVRVGLTKALISRMSVTTKLKKRNDTNTQMLFFHGEPDVVEAWLQERGIVNVPMAARLTDDGKCITGARLTLREMFAACIRVVECPVGKAETRSLKPVDTD